MPVPQNPVSKTNPPDSDFAHLRSLVRRVVARAMREPALGDKRRHSGGVLVEFEASSSAGQDQQRPQAAPEPFQRGLQLIAVEDLDGVANGAEFEVPAGARLTALAQDEILRRGISLREKSGCSSGARRLRVALGADHGGYTTKEKIKAWLEALGHEALDFGTHDESAADYPDFASQVGEAVAGGQADFGVCVDGAGIGSAMAANKVPGVRAAACYDERTARNAREHNYANVLSLGGPMLGEKACHAILLAFLKTPEGAPRHGRRVQKIMEIEARGTGRARPVTKVLPSPGET
jgi:ribose 5-phosphate isomerase B